MTPSPTERQLWMRAASDLLLKEGVTADFTDLARTAYKAGATPERFVGAVNILSAAK